MPSESKIEDDCCAVAADAGGSFIKVRFVGRRGGNDRLLVLPYLPTVYVELKTFDGRQSKLQQEVERELVSLGQPYWVVRSADELRRRIAVYKEKCSGAVIPGTDEA